MDVLSFELTAQCANALTPKFTFAESDFYFNVEVTTTTITPNGYSDLFDNTDAASCPVDSCALKYDSAVGTDCDTLLDSSVGEVYDPDFKIRFQ